MSGQLDDNIKRWTAKRKSALVIEIIQGKMTVAEASRSYDLAPSEIENWVDDARKGMENALRTNPLDVRERYEKQLRDLQEAYGEAMLELRAWETGSEARAGIRKWMEFYNRTRPHSALGGKRPAVIYWQAIDQNQHDPQVQRVA